MRGEQVAGDPQRLAEEVERAAVRGAGLGAGIAVDEVALDRDRIRLRGVVQEARAAAAAGIVPEHIALDPARDVVQRKAGAGQLVAGALVVVDVVVGDVEALRLVIFANDRLRIAADVEAVDDGALVALGAGILDADERAAAPGRLGDIGGGVAHLEALAALEAAREREGFLARLELLGVAALRDADDGAGVSRGGDRSGDRPVRPLRGPIAAAARAGIHERRARDHLGRARDRDGARPTARLRALPRWAPASPPARTIARSARAAIAECLKMGISSVDEGNMRFVVEFVPATTKHRGLKSRRLQSRPHRSLDHPCRRGHSARRAPLSPCEPWSLRSAHNT